MIERPSDDDPTAGAIVPRDTQEGEELARSMRAQDLPANLGTEDGPRGKELVQLRRMHAELSAMLVGPKEEADWSYARRHIKLLISRWEMDTPAKVGGRDDV